MDTVTVFWDITDCGNDNIYAIQELRDKILKNVRLPVLKAIGGEFSCDNLKTIGLKYFVIDGLPEMSCKQHEEIKDELIK